MVYLQGVVPLLIRLIPSGMLFYNTSVIYITNVAQTYYVDVFHYLSYILTYMLY